MKEMMTSGDFADVTLVCDDKKKIRAHRNILAACSPVFKDILQIENSSVVYLKGVYSSEMESIIQFIYLGEATFYEERMNHFLEAAKSLDIKELNKEVDETEEFNNTVEDSVQANKMEDSETRNRFDENQTADLDHHSIDKIKITVSNAIKALLAFQDYSTIGKLSMKVLPMIVVNVTTRQH